MISFMIVKKIQPTPARSWNFLNKAKDKNHSKSPQIITRWLSDTPQDNRGEVEEKTFRYGVISERYSQNPKCGCEYDYELGEGEE